MASSDREQVARLPVEGTPPSIPRTARVPPSSQASQSTPLTTESAKATRKDFVATAKTRFGFSSFGARKENDPLKNSRAYEDISPSSAHPHAPQITLTPATRIPTPNFTRTVSSSPVPTTSSPITRKPLPNRHITSRRSDLPKQQRSPVDAQEKPLAQGVVKRENRPPMSPARPTAITSMSDLFKTKELSAKKLDMNETLPRPRFPPIQKDFHNISHNKILSSPLSPSLEPSAKNMDPSPSITVRETKASAARAAAVTERRAVEEKLSTAGIFNWDSTSPPPDPFNRKTPARSSGVFKSSIPTLSGAPGAIHMSPPFSQQETGTRSQFAKFPKISPNLKIDPFEDGSKAGSRGPRECSGSANSIATFIPTSGLGVIDVQTPTTETQHLVPALLIPETRIPKVVDTAILPTEQGVEVDVTDADSTLVHRESCDTTQEVDATQQDFSTQEVAASEEVVAAEEDIATDEDVAPDYSGSDEVLVSEIGSLRGFEQSKQVLRSNRLSARYGPTLRISPAADRDLLSGNDLESKPDDRQVIKHHPSLATGLLRRAVQSLPRSITSSSLTSTGTDDEEEEDMPVTEKSKSKVVPVQRNSTGVPRMTEALHFNPQISNIDAILDFANETTASQNSPGSWLRQNESLLSEPVNTGSDSEPWISPLRPSANAKTLRKSTYNPSSSPLPPFAVAPQSATKRFIKKLLHKKSTDAATTAAAAEAARQRAEEAATRAEAAAAQAAEIAQEMEELLERSRK